MQDSSIEQLLVDASQHGVHVQVLLPAPSGSSSDSNSQGISVIQRGGVQVREDAHLYMHAKIFKEKATGTNQSMIEYLLMSI